MTEKISHIPAFQNIWSPMKKKGDGYVPDKSSRYFQEDFSFGLSFIKIIGDQLEVDMPHITKIYNWASRFISIKQPDFKIEF